ncbi:MAG: undecaprenyldiphospho-muramoylpentapeptide beta-N-acetylglucosaminyltransferase, partial [Neisseriaceae bacterium]|nr:undecaprenyldiphospho-muramoylpentapeptide beta-N-acetylglucosaminyltransferase [Neisseriaceae bacterium]
MSDLDQQQMKAKRLQHKKILIMAGGTGGHIFPAVAVAQRLQSEGCSVVWLGGAGGMETRLVPQHGFHLEVIEMRGLRGKGLRSLLTAPWMILKALVQAHQVIKKHQPNMVIGFGGYTGFAGGIAAKLHCKPLVVHEQNAVAGLTNRVLSIFATRTLCAFPLAFGATAHEEDWVGNPVRGEIVSLVAPQDRFADRAGVLNVLVMGGSLGAQVFNEVLPLALALIPSENRPKVIHQSGEKHRASLIKNYQMAGIKDVDCVPFIGDMAQAYAQADVILCRAGALTVAEL